MRTFLFLLLALTTCVFSQRPFFSDSYPNYPCRNNPCKNGGLCTLSKTKLMIDYTCVCQPGFFGNNCEAKEICSSSQLPTVFYPASSQMAGFPHGTTEILVMTADIIIPYEIVYAIRAAALITSSTFGAAVPYYSSPTKDFFGNLRSKPVSERTHDNMNLASIYAGVRIAEYLFQDNPTSLNTIRERAIQRGMNLNLTEACLSTPWGIGNLVASEIFEYSERDGFNSVGDVGKTSNFFPFNDWTGFTPVNNLFKINDLTKWTPLLEPSGSYGYNTVQNHVAAQAGSSTSFSLTKNDLAKVFVSPTLYPFKVSSCGINSTHSGCRRLQSEAESVLSAMNNLNDWKKMVAEHFDNKFVSLGFIVFQFHQQIPLGHEDITNFALAFDYVLYDSMIVAWRQKAINNNVRPVTVIRNIFKRSQVTTWAKGKGVNSSIMAADFQSYLRTMPHTEYPSGTSCFCQAATEFYQQFFQTNNLSQQHLFKAGSSKIETGKTPSQDMLLNISSLSGMNDICGISRVNAGVHFRSAVREGKRLCSGIAQKVLAQLSNRTGKTPVVHGV